MSARKQAKGAVRKHSRPSSIALRSTAIVKRSAPPPARTQIDPASLPEMYALRVMGDCMSPLVPHGAQAVFSKTEAYKVGDIVVIWHRRDILPPGALQCGVKRLVLAPMKGIKFPFVMHPQSEVAPAFFVESIHPANKRYVLDCRNVEAIHKFVRLQGDQSSDPLTAPKIARE